jgi:hypothetical protein
VFGPRRTFVWVFFGLVSDALSFLLSGSERRNTGPPIQYLMASHMRIIVREMETSSIVAIEVSWSLGPFSQADQHTCEFSDIVDGVDSSRAFWISPFGDDLVVLELLHRQGEKTGYKREWCKYNRDDSET